MESKRQKQISELIKRNFSLFLQDEGRLIYGSTVFVTVTDVKITPDFAQAKIYLSIYNTENKQEPILEMRESYHRIKQEMAHRLKSQMRRIPEFDFFIDDTIDEMYRVQALFDRLYEEDQMGSPDSEQ
ncbi:MAG: 30S ribosome-binding factor RbfA [Saprospiraceae bacterium]